MPAAVDPPPKLKLVIRRLPPHLPEVKFWESVEPWLGPAAGETQAEGQSSSSGCLWRRWVQGRVADESLLYLVFSRAYVLMPSQEAALEFHKAYDGHAFRSKDGQEYRAQIELAPSQKVPTAAQAALNALLRASGSKEGKAKAPKVRVDARQGQIDTDADYLSFLRSLETPLEKPKPEDFVSSTPAPTTSTPLLDHLRQQRLAKKAALASQKTSRPQPPSTAATSANAGARNRPPKQRGSNSPKTGKQALPSVASGSGDEARRPVAILKRENNGKSGAGGGAQRGAQAPRGEGGRQAPAPQNAGPGSVPPPNASQPARNHPSKRDRERERQAGGAGAGGAGAALLSAALSASTGQDRARAKQGGRSGREGAPPAASAGKGAPTASATSNAARNSGAPSAAGGPAGVQGEAGVAGAEKKKRTRGKKPGGAHSGAAADSNTAITPAPREARIDD